MRSLLIPLKRSIADVERDVSERLFTILDAIRAETLQDLQRYYRAEMGLSDFSIRLGNLLTICHNVRVSYLLLKFCSHYCWNFSFSGVHVSLPNILPNELDALRLVVDRRTVEIAHPLILYDCIKYVLNLTSTLSRETSQFNIKWTFARDSADHSFNSTNKGGQTCKTDCVFGMSILDILIARHGQHFARSFAAALHFSPTLLPPQGSSHLKSFP